MRLLHGDFAAETRYDDGAQALLAKYRGYGADWLHVVDLDGARDGSAGNRGRHRASSPPRTAVKLQVGGGLRNTARGRADAAMRRRPAWWSAAPR